MTEEIQSSDIFANATIVGMKPLDDQSVVKDISAFRPGLVVADAVYDPEETKLLREAKEAGCTCVGGKGMLLWQGVAGHVVRLAAHVSNGLKSRIRPVVGRI